MRSMPEQLKKRWTYHYEWGHNRHCYKLEPNDPIEEIVGLHEEVYTWFRNNGVNTIEELNQMERKCGRGWIADQQSCQEAHDSVLTLGFLATVFPA